MSTLVADKGAAECALSAVRYAAGWPQNCNLLAHRGQDRGSSTPILTAARRPVVPGLDQLSILGNFGSRSHVSHSDCKSRSRSVAKFRNTWEGGLGDFMNRLLDPAP